MNKVFLSKFVHVFNRSNVYCYYHTLNLKTIYLTQEQNSEVISFLKNNIEPSEHTDIIEVLKQNEFLILDDDEDEKQFDNVIKNVLSPQITVGYLIISEKCNLACNYCFIKNVEKNKSKSYTLMSKSIAKRCLDVFIQQSILCSDFTENRELIFYGGEPLLNFEILKYVVTLYHQYQIDGRCPFKINFSVVTNGTLITNKNAIFFKENNINVSISIDGPSIKANKNRVFLNSNKCAFSSILNGINLLKEHKCTFGLSYTLSEDALLVPIPDLIAFLKQNLITSISFNTLICRDHLKKKEYYEAAANYIIEFSKEAFINHIYEDRMSRKMNALAKRQFLYNDCAATAGCQLCFYPNGNIGICHGCKKEKLKSNWNVLSLEQINYVKSKEFIHWLENSPIYNEKCKDCSAIGVCGGGCVINKQANTENKNIDLGFCIQSKKILEFLIWYIYDCLKLDLKDNI